ncbi:BTB domain-containing protein [Mycena kentingensis (nom. inval.)]|nr:BTB domain-containing protein [Mycena kentingensis (nom. inval.)]
MAQCVFQDCKDPAKPGNLKGTCLFHTCSETGCKDIVDACGTSTYCKLHKCKKCGECVAYAYDRTKMAEFCNAHAGYRGRQPLSRARELAFALSAMNAEPKPCTQSTHFWFRDHGMLIFEVQGVLFRVHEYFLHRDSPVLRDMMPLEIAPNGPEPIFHLDGVKSKDFEHLLWLYYNPSITNYDAPKSTWLAILRLADRFEMEAIKKLALSNLLRPSSPEAALDPLERIILCERDDLSREQATEAYLHMCTREAPLSVEELRQLTEVPEVVGIIVSVREETLRLRQSAERSAEEAVKAALAGGKKRSG